MAKPDLKVAGRWRYYGDEEGHGTRCACHGIHFDTPDEMVKWHKQGANQEQS